MRQPISRLCFARTARNYLTAVLLNIALLNTVLSANDRPATAQVRIVSSGKGFRDTELVKLEDGLLGVASVPYQFVTEETAIGRN